MNNDLINNATIRQARQMAIKAHGDQLYGDLPYVVHLDAVAELVAPHGQDAIVIAYLHDTLEDTALTIEEIEAAFGPTVARCVSLMTDPEGPSRKTRKAALHARLTAVAVEYPGEPDGLALVVKVADRLANVRASVLAEDKGKILMYWEEHPEFRRAALRNSLNIDLFDRIDEWFLQCFSDYKPFSG